LGPGRIVSGFSTAARIALVGLITPPAAVGLASFWGMPMRSGVASLLVFGGLAGFGAAGAVAGSSMGRGGRATAGFAAGFLLGGGLIVPAIQSLQGLSGHEPLVTVSAFVIGALGAGFGLAGLIGALIGRMTGHQVRRLTVNATLAGMTGGLIALGPPVLARLHLTFAGAAYLALLVAAVSFLLCVIVPFRWIGHIADEELGSPPETPGLGLGR
jgi:hypothetical protein